MTIVLENSSLADFSHWDMWLVQRQRTGAQPEFKCYAPLGGCGHRASGTQHAGELFGGAWLPGCDDPRTKQATDAYLLSIAPSIVRNWVQECMTVNPDINRGDRMPYPLPLPFLCTQTPLVVGLYCFQQSTPEVLPELWMEVPLVIRVLKKPSWKCRIDFGALSDLDEVWDIQQWRKTDVEMTVNAEDDPLHAELLYTAKLRFADVAMSYLPICPRLGDMVIKADNEGFGYAGWQLACLLASGAASFDIALAEHAMSAYTPDQPPLIRLLAIVEDLNGFLTNLQQRLLPCTQTQNEQLLLQALKVYPRRLQNAVDLFRRFADRFWWSRGHLSDSAVVTRLTELLAQRFPEQVAVLGAEGDWYAGGCRVRSENVKIQEGSRQIFLVNPGIGRPNISDWNQNHLKPVFCLQLSIPIAPPLHVNIISDSTLANSAFVYGIARKLWSMDMFLLWTGVRDGATATDLSEAWTKAPECSIGLTVWNCNDGVDIELAFVQELVQNAKQKCLMPVFL